MPMYRPALRFKEGEYTALAALPEDMRREITPFFVIPPLSERDPEKGRSIRSDEIAYVTGERIGRYWPMRSAYIDLRFVLPDIADEDVARLFRQAATKNECLIPVVPALDANRGVWKGIVRKEIPRVAIYISHSDLDDELLSDALIAIDVDASECELFVDFTGAELRPDIAAESVAASLEELAMSQQWACVVFQASNYPIKNPADAGGECSVPRHEWEIYKQLLEAAVLPLERLGYSDFGPDSGVIAFPKSAGGGKPIPHLRYTTPTHTLVVRGGREGNQSAEIRALLKKLTSRSEFSGAAFSVADNEMHAAADGNIGVGNATTWRRWNMGHHFAAGVWGIGSITGHKFGVVAVSEAEKQIALFE